MFQTTLATGVVLLFLSIGLLPTHAQKKMSVYSADDPYGFKVMGMPKAHRKYLITDLPGGTEIPVGYNYCEQGVYYQKERVRGVDITAVMVHFRAQGDFKLTGDPPDFSKGKFEPAFETYVPPDWVALTFTLMKDSFTIQEIRLIRVFPRGTIPGTNSEWRSILIDGLVTRVDRSWVSKDPYATWEILPESQLSHLIFRVRLPESTKACIQGKK